MELYIGGYAQGKLAYVLREKNLENGVVFDGADGIWEDAVKNCGTKKVFYHFETWVRRGIELGQPVEDEVKKLLEHYPDFCFISDEVGNGIVPLEPFEREYRERLGRILCLLAQRSTRMERILCGMGQRLK